MISFNPRSNQALQAATEPVIGFIAKNDPLIFDFV